MPLDRTDAILLVENEPLIAMDLEEMLRASGFDRVTHVVSTRDALDWLDHSSAGLVILDLVVGDGSTAPVAERLRQSGTPFVVCSGHARDEAPFGAVFQDAIWLSKPCRESDLALAVEQASRLPPR